MSVGTAIFLSTVLVLAYHFAYHNPKCRKAVLWVLGVALTILIVFVIWASS